MKKLIIAASLLVSSSTYVIAADYTDGNVDKNDSRWMQANFMYSSGELPNESDHGYVEFEFGGRAGIIDYYGYVDVFNVVTNRDSDKYNEDKTFIKFSPRASLDALFEKDLSAGPIKELYFATLFNWGGGNDEFTVNNSFWGLGSDIEVPWLGKVGFNTYGLYDLNQKEWNGYQVSTNWFKPIHSFDNGSFISYQGYIDYQFGMKEKYGSTASNGGAMYNGIYWHSDRFAVGYGLKAYKDVYGLKDGIAWPGAVTTGFSHYFAVTYKL